MYKIDIRSVIFGTLDVAVAVTISSVCSSVPLVVHA